jgi:phosphohistidine phosphatase
MELYLLRHGDAEPRELSSSDAERALTAKGKRDVQIVTRQARMGNVRPDVVLTSPLRRAKETAAIAQKEMGVKRILETKALLPDTAPETLWKELSSLEGAERVLLAGHEPCLSRLAQFLLRAKVGMDFKKGAMLRITLALIAMPGARETQGVLKWMITPRLVRKRTRTDSQ